ncbi:hypothetical protein AAU57_07805 [Nonlabens sp. YIK11]|uniref:DUF6364 family protein n=1 Tax=Nonlabens sp. YIK11 TaxID=1453349 RepID=UPI0006DCE7DB|nr:DUF6364 family protein [Nonlabens sp. YIK11]KQC33230.1 hypothetical protein AAU57_07805 [Nonlabens sp. YIK11]
MATKNLTIRLSDQLIEANKKYAKKLGKSLNEMIREFLQRNVQNEDEKSWADEWIEFSEKNAKDIGYTWNREEANER